MDAGRRPMRDSDVSVQNVFVPGYIALRKLGGGGQADVFQAARRNDNGDNGIGTTRFALKAYHGKRAQRAMLTELRILVALQGHSNIIRLVERFESDPGVNAVVLELCDTDLNALQSQRSLSESDVVHITRGALRGLEHMHRFDMVHRDVKPENIAVVGDGSARLMDFGVAAYMSDTAEMRRRCGSLEYMAPEMLAKKPYGLSVDIFAFGVTLYYVLGKQFPLAAPGMTYEAAVAKSARYELSFGSNFDHVGNDAIKLMQWLMHPCSNWRPDATFALTCPPFAPSPQVEHDHDHEVPSFEMQLQSRVAAEIHARPPVQQRVGPGRPTPLRQFKDHAAHLDAPDSNVSTSDALPLVVEEDDEEEEVDCSQVQEASEVNAVTHAAHAEQELRADSFAERLRRKLLDEVRKSCILDVTFANMSADAIAS